jgi:gas vesicle protein
MNEETTSPSKTPAGTSPSDTDLQQTAKETARSAKAEIETLKNAAQDEGHAVLEQIKTAAQSATLQAQEAGRDFVDEQKENLAQKVDQYSQALRVASERLRSDEGNMLADPAQKAADRLERMSGYLREKQIPDVLDDLESYARRKPEVVFGGLFVVGLAAARFFKASRKRPQRGPAEAGLGCATSHELSLSPPSPSSSQAIATASSTP